MPVPLDPPAPRKPRASYPLAYKRKLVDPLQLEPTEYPVHRQGAGHADEGAKPVGPRLPHERDLHRDPPTAPRPEMVQADADLAAGLEDTDCRNRAAETIAHSPRFALPRTRQA